MKTVPIVRFAILSAALAACDAKEASPSASGASAEAPGASASPAAAATEPASAAAAAPAAAGTCPEGRWEYDYSDQALESMAANTPGLRVVKEKGTITCTFRGREQATVTCEASEGGVENVMEATIGGAGKMTVAVTITGKATTEFEKAGPTRLKTTKSDLGSLKVQASATIGGNTVPVPALDLLPGWDKAGTIIDYVCEGDTLKLKPQVAGLKNDWQHLKRVP
jgi:hypothetical protein